MKYIAQWMEKNREKLWFAVLSHGLLLFFLLLIFRPIYETNDDMGISQMVNGAKGDYDAHLIFIHYFIGVVLEGLYRLTGEVPWYALLQYIVLFLSFSAVTYVLNRKWKHMSSVWISAVVTLYFSYEGYIKLQSTKTAGIAAASGIFLMFYALAQEKIRKRALVCGMLLACTGFMYRQNQFYAEGALMTGIGLYLLLELRNTEAGKRLKRACMYFAAFGCMMVMVVFLYKTEQWAYRSPQWQEFIEYNLARARLYDYGFPDYEANEQAYLELGIDRNAYDMIRGWNHMDTEKITTETMQALDALKAPTVINKEFLKSFLRTFPSGFFTIPCFFCFCMVLVYWLLWGKHGWDSFLTLLYEMAVVGAVYFYLFYRGRYLYNRVDVGLWMAVCLVILWTYQEGKGYFNNRVGLALVLTLFCAVQPTWKRNWRLDAADKEAKQEKIQSQLEQIENDKEHLYLLKMDTLSFAEAYGVFERIPFGIAENIFPLGGWPSPTELFMRAVVRYGIDNPFPDMINNENVYLVDQEIQVTLQYLRTYYDANAEAVEIGKLGNNGVYQIVSE